MPTKTVVAIADAEALTRLEAAGLSLGARLAALRAQPGTAPESDSVAALPDAWNVVVAEVRRELASVAVHDPAAGVSVARYSHRLFDERWLTSQAARFELIGVVSRLDRAPFDEVTCGETRLVYRLSYVQIVAGRRVRSRLPMTLILEYAGAPRTHAGPPEAGCQEAARAWQVPETESTGVALAEQLLKGPLSPTLFDHSKLHQLGVNVQTVRWPSTVRPDLAGHAEYLLLGFSWDPIAQTLVPLALENTPDVSRLRANAQLRGELAAWIGANMAAIDRGTARIPDRFLAKRARSVTPRGLTRLENRPYRSIFEPNDFAALFSTGPEARQSVRSPEGLLRRLDDASCQGCHESRSVAGFHFLGTDVDGEAGNTLVSAVSPHVEDELVRRRIVTEALARGEPVDFRRPSAERGHFDGYGAHCGLGDTSFADWTCAPGLTCQAYDAPKSELSLVGTCLPAQPRVGDPCEVGAIEQSLDPRKDRVAAARRTECGGALACNSNEVGFPGGMCSSSCNAQDEDTRCGPIAILAPFNACLARGEPFPACLREHVRPAGLRACSAQSPCRDDYICAQADPGKPDQGVCLPPYFLFQLRVDGHGM